jgi:hypothetical protein
VITGFNTDIEHGGVTYHVQTEDKGLEHPIILSLVYVGGAILASKRTPYADLVANGFEEKTLTERLQRQHKLICAAIRAGRVEDLKRMAGDAATPAQDKPSKPPAQAIEPAVAAVPPPVIPTLKPAPLPPPPLEIVRDLSTEIIHDTVTPIIPEGITITHPAPFAGEVVAEEPIPVTVYEELDEAHAEAHEEDDTLSLSILDDEGDFRAGQLATIKIYVGRGGDGRKAVAGAAVTVKILGTTFRPMILTTETDEEGLAIVRALLPQFTTGRAAIVIRAMDASGDFTEVRRIIHQ